MIVLRHRREWSLVERCNNGCHSKLEIEQNDIYVTLNRDEVKEFNYTFRCPCCNIESNIDERELPNYIKISALEQLKNKLGFMKEEH